MLFQNGQELEEWCNMHSYDISIFCSGWITQWVRGTDKEEITIKIHLLACRNLLWDILILPSSYRAALDLYVNLTLWQGWVANQPPYALLYIGARRNTHCATGDGFKLQSNWNPAYEIYTYSKFIADWCSARIWHFRLGCQTRTDCPWYTGDGFKFQSNWNLAYESYTYSMLILSLQIWLGMNHSPVSKLIFGS